MMAISFRTIALLLTINQLIQCDQLEDYMKKRNDIINSEAQQAFGGDIQLNDNEQIVDELILKLKEEEINVGFYNPAVFNYSHHYFEYKDKIKYSKVYNIIKNMPKGAALHVHDTGLLKPDYLLNITYTEDLYVCIQKNNSVKYNFLFAEMVPEQPCVSKWQLMRDLRLNIDNVKELDEDIRKQFTLFTKTPHDDYPDINKVWSRFQNIFITITPLLTYSRIWDQYFYDALTEFQKENILYLELRTTMPNLYELNGTVHDLEYTVEVYNNALLRFMSNNPSFIGAKIIYAPSRNVDNKTVESYLETAKVLSKSYPNIIAGFDLVGQEDIGHPTIDFLPELLNQKDKLKFFFHAGETNWYGTSSDWNLLDAILLGSKRLGHAYALLKHPNLIELVKEKDIGIEVNVISNQVLKLVDDLRNHPLSIFFANNLPVVISSDDPGLWEAEPISHDFYVAFTGVMSKGMGLKALKKLVWNSVKYSSMDKHMMSKAYDKLEKDWIRFINRIALETAGNTTTVSLIN